MSETTALGAAMAAGAAKGVEVWNLSPGHLPHITSEEYEPKINSDGKEAKTQRKCVILSMWFSKKVLKHVTLKLLPSSGCYDHDCASWKNRKRAGKKSLCITSPDPPVCLSVRPLHREWVPLLSLEESRPESHELGDHRTLLQCQRYSLVLFKKCMTEVRSYSSCCINLWNTGVVFIGFLWLHFSCTLSGDRVQESDCDPSWMLSFLFTDNRFRKEDEWRPLGGPSQPSSHQSRPLRSDISAAACHVWQFEVLQRGFREHGHIFRHY